MPRCTPNYPAVSLSLLPLVLIHMYLCSMQVLQNLSNAREFGAKESYMAACNPFIQDHKEKIMNFFSEVVRVEERDHLRCRVSLTLSNSTTISPHNNNGTERRVRNCVSWLDCRI